MESVDDYGVQLLSILPPFLQARLPTVPARLRSLASLQSSDPSNGGSTQSSHRSKITATFSSNTSSSSHSNSSSFSDSTDSLPSGTLTSASRHSATTTLSSILADDDTDQHYPGGTMADHESMDDVHYEQLMRHFLRSVREVDTRRQLDNRRLLEGSQAQHRGHDMDAPRLPRNFNGQIHDIVDQRWSPSGIKWRYARQGAQLATDASREMEDPEFERSAYIDAVAYYLRALPEELDAGETAKLLAAAPRLTLPHPEPQIAISRPTDRGRTFLADAVQYAVIGLVLFGHMLWCFLLSALRIGAYFEREYHLTQWMMDNGYDLVNSVGRRSVVWTARLNAMNDGRLGQVVSWTMDSVTGGIYEGYGRGIERIRQRNNQAQERASIVDLRRKSRDQ